jgi:ABC-type nitrate/sulfonate/bicarbonate transport system ATPase subunit
MVSVTRRTSWLGRRAAQHEVSRSGPTRVRVGASSAPGLVVRGVSKAFAELPVLDDVSFEVPLHHRIALVGPSGCGKSTLLSIVAGLEEPDRGVVSTLGGSGPRERLASCALMPQRDLLFQWRTALDNACVALENQGVSRSEARRRTQPFFERFGLAQFESARPSELSGGMRQRVSFIRTLMAGKEVLLLDEPFGALDSLTRAQMQAWLLDALATQPRTVFLVTHDVEEALLLSQRVVVMSARPGRVLEVIDVDVPPAPTRRETITTPEFVALKDRALEVLEQ